MDLRSVSLDDPSSLLDLAPPDPRLLQEMAPDELHEVCTTFLRLWKDILLRDRRLPIDHYEVRANDPQHPLDLSGEDLWDYCLLLVSTYYNAAFMAYIQVPAEKRKPLPPGIAFSTLKEFIPKEDTAAGKIAFLRVLTHHYLTALHIANLIHLFKQAPIPPPFLTEYEKQLHGNSHDMFKSQALAPSGFLRHMANTLTSSALSYTRAVYEDVPSTDFTHIPGPFSAIRPGELPLLAKRDTTLLRRYGEARLSKVLEYQLALTVQSFGLYVVSARVGNTTVDLVCVSSHPEQKLTFIIEAKSTARPYHLPRKDARALKQYVEDLRSTLESLPQLAFALLLGPEPSSTLNDKLLSLQAEIGLPVRFMSARLMARLREQIPGPLPMRIFSNQILISPPILEDSFVPAIVNAFLSEQRAHAAFVESMLSARGVT